MSLEETKTRLIKFGRYAEERGRKERKKPWTFTYLGFTHYYPKSRNGKFRVKRKTNRKKFARKCKEIYRQIKSMRTKRIEDIVKKLNEILAGYYHYYEITDNIEKLNEFRCRMMKIL